MNVYVLGAGVSKCVGYPVGTELFDEIDKYVRCGGACVDRFENWGNLHNWLESNPNPLIAQAYRTKNIEHLFTVLDLARALRSDAATSMVAEERGTAPRADKAATLNKFALEVNEYRKYRDMLMWALEHYFAWRHGEDSEKSKERDWDTLRAFGEKLASGDVVITFNYDASLERILLKQGKWSPEDGYGFELSFQSSPDDKSPVKLATSPVLVLHLHGASGWYRRPWFTPGYQLPPGGGAALPFEAYGAAPQDTDVSLDPRFLQGLGISYVDACLPDTRPVGREMQVVLHPSFLKDYETDDEVFIKLWQKAAQALRDAERTYIIGYSLPIADVAVFTLLLTTLRERAATVVNPTGTDLMRLRNLFSGELYEDSRVTLEQWLQ
jgi:hypothetical protein